MSSVVHILRTNKISLYKNGHWRTCTKVKLFNDTGTNSGPPINNVDPTLTVMFQSIQAAPRSPPPTPSLVNCGAFARPVSPEGGALVRPWGRKVHLGF